MAIRVIANESSDGGITIVLAPVKPARPPIEVDFLASKAVEDRLEAELAKGRTRYVIDLRAVSYLHSRAFWSIVKTGEQAARAGGGVVLLDPSPYVRDLVELTSAADVLQVRSAPVAAPVAAPVPAAPPAPAQKETARSVLVRLQPRAA
jgi:anti-anti-sigma factor